MSDGRLYWHCLDCGAHEAVRPNHDPQGGRTREKRMSDQEETLAWGIPVECQECGAPATWTDEPPPRSATANDWYCDKHLPAAMPEPIRGRRWTRLRLVEPKP